MARHRRRPEDDYSDGSNLDSPDDVSLSDEDEWFDVEVDDAGYEISPTNIDDEGSNDTGNFGDDCDDFDIEDQVQLFDGNLHPREYYLKQLKEFNEAAFDDEDYSKGSTILLDGIEELWNKYCAWFEYDPQESFESVSLGSLYNFFDWLLGQKAGKDGRKKRGTKKSSSLGTYWKVYRLVYERATGAKLDAKLNRKMHRVGSSPARAQNLAKKYGLSDQKLENRCMTVDDLKQQVETTLGTTEKSFSLGELRILCVLFLLLLAPTGARPASVPKLRYRDIRVVLAWDPEGGPHKVLIKFTLEFTKTYLGTKDAKTVTLPEVMFDDSLMLSPHVFLEGILFRHLAFDAPSLTCPDAVSKLGIHPGEWELCLPLKASVDDVYIFRRAVKTLIGYEMSPTDPNSPATIAGWVRRVGELTVFEVPTIPYNLRYNAANVFDRSGNVNDATRNLMLDHANSNPFQKHYLGRQLAFDPYALIRGLEPQNALVQKSSSIGHSISKRRPVNLTPDQAASVKSHPGIKKLACKAKELRQQAKHSRKAMEKYKKAHDKLRSARQTQRRVLKDQIREHWTNKQAVIDIENQLAGLGFVEEPAIWKSNRPKRPAQKRLMDAVTAPVESTVEGQHRRRDVAIYAVMAYCVVVEGPAVRRTNTSRAGTMQRSSVQDEPREDGRYAEYGRHAAVLSVFIASEEERPRRCFLCVGMALGLELDDPCIEELTHEFYSAGDHLTNIREGDDIECGSCYMPLDHKMHLQHHALQIHGTVSY
ncbi:C2H2 finger domain protein [Apodospora peruviana]|uniref:C2H2 finger domain protein n=1 Tax=Apodospora peruviana TaxID=516989 RepID=A0AAE0I4U4_9PEZI|nr:C2H2 finger domain protein [Apodospora peruviana]